jgi:hypothetical protein
MTELQNDIHNNLVQIDFDAPLWSKMSKDVRALSHSFDQRSVRELVATYYRIQDDRIALAAQARELQKANSPHELVEFLADNLSYMEASLKYPLQRFSETYAVGNWALSQYGIGPVITAGLIAHIDITKAHTAGSVWRYAGLDPTISWEKGQKRPFNAELKTLSWKIGQSFMKFSNRDECFYGKLYRQDKERRTSLNESGAFADKAKQQLQNKNWKNNKTSSLLKQGLLSSAQIDAQARRFAVKIFLSHFHAVWFEDYHKKPAPTPYTIAHMDHVHEIQIPNYTPIPKV